MEYRQVPEDSTHHVDPCLPLGIPCSGSPPSELHGHTYQSSRKGLARGPQQREGVREATAARVPPFAHPLPFRPSPIPSSALQFHRPPSIKSRPYLAPEQLPRPGDPIHATQLPPTAHPHISAAARGRPRGTHVAAGGSGSSCPPGYPQVGPVPRPRRRPNSEPSGVACRAPRLVPCRVAAEPAPPHHLSPGDSGPCRVPERGLPEDRPAMNARPLPQALPFA